MTHLISLALFMMVVASVVSAQTPSVDHYSAADLAQKSKQLKVLAEQKPDGSAGETLKKYPGHFTMISVRNKPGVAELHAHHADIFFVVDGSAVLVTGGTILNSKTTEEGEIRGTVIEGGSSTKLAKGDVVHISPNTPHQLQISAGDTFTYFVVKVHE